MLTGFTSVAGVDDAGVPTAVVGPVVIADVGYDDVSAMLIMK